MFIDLVFFYAFDKLNREYKRILGKCKCDLCGVIYTKGNVDWRPYVTNPNKLTFCSPEHARIARRKNNISDNKLREKNLIKYGVEHTLQLAFVQDKSKNTCLERFGTEKPLQNAEIKLKAKNTIIEIYGVNNAYLANSKNWNYEEICAKRITTMKTRGTICTSQPEEKLYELLVNKFSYVERQVPVSGDFNWIVDFFIPEENLFIQMDGAYWHGLNRNIDIIKESKKPRDKKILSAINSDNLQNIWFQNQGLKLIRITDSAIKNMSELPDDLSSIAYFTC